MANTSFLKRLIKEDFNKKDQDLIGKIAFVFNPALQQIVNMLNHGLLISDLNTQVKDLTITVDSSGFPVNPVSFKSSLSGRCGMIQVGRAQSTTNGVYPTSGHSVSFTDNNGQITINNVTGLSPGVAYTVRVIAYV